MGDLVGVSDDTSGELGVVVCVGDIDGTTVDKTEDEIVGSNVSSKFGDALGSTNAGIVWAVTRTRSGKVTAALVEMYVPVIATVASGVSESIGDGVSIIGLVVRGEV